MVQYTKLKINRQKAMFFKVLDTYKQSGKEYILAIPIHNEQPVMEINNCIGKYKKR